MTTNNELSYLLDQVPDYQAFLTVDEMHASSHQLANEYPEVVDIVPLGHSRNGQPIEALKIGNGSKTGFMVGLPHPNEPIGAMMLEFFSRKLAEDAELRDRLDYTWYIVKAIDPDGTRLNEGWFKGPFTITNYARHFYRPPSEQQVEWTFPVQYKNYAFETPLPETRAWMQLIDQHPPDFIFSLHNAGFGGVYLYLSNDLPEMYPPFYALVKDVDLPLHLGEPEVPFALKYADAVFGMIGFKDMYDFMEQHLDTDPAEQLSGGASSYEYAKRSGNPLYLVCEMPYFYSAAINDLSQSDVIRRDAMLDSIAVQREKWRFMQHTLDHLAHTLTLKTPFRDAITLNLKSVFGRLDSMENFARNNPDMDKHATVAEAFDNAYGARFYTLLSTGMLLRMIEEEIQHTGELSILTEARDAVQKAFDEEAQYLEDGIEYSAIPIRKLVQVQLASAFLALEAHH